MWNMFIVNNKDIRTTSVTSFWCLYCYLWTHYKLFFNVFIVNFENASVCWVLFQQRSVFSKLLIKTVLINAKNVLNVHKVNNERHLLINVLNIVLSVFKVNNKDTRRTSFCSLWNNQKTTGILLILGGMKWRPSGVFIVNFEQIS